MSDSVDGRATVRLHDGRGFPCRVDPLEARVLLAASPRLVSPLAPAASPSHARVLKLKASPVSTGLLGALSTAFNTYQDRLHSAASAKWWHVRRASETAAATAFKSAVPQLLDISADAA